MSEEKRYYWLKLKEDVFSSKRIKKLRKLAGGDTYFIIYLKLQLASLKTEGILTWTGLEDDMASELALEIDEEPENVEVVLRYLLSCGLAECPDAQTLFLPWVVANTGSETGAAERMRRSRENKLLERNNVTPMSQERYTEIEKEKEIEKESESDTGRVMSAWNSLGLSKVTKILPDSERGKLLKKRIKDYGLDEVLKAIDMVRESDFLMGGGDRGWTVTFDWFIKPNNFAKVHDGNYSTPKQKPNKVTTAARYQAPKPTNLEELRKAVAGIAEK